MTVKYTVKLEDIIAEESKFIVRLTELNIRETIRGNWKLSRYPSSLKDIGLKLNEVYMELDKDKILKIDNDNTERDKFISYINRKIRKNMINVAFPNIYINGIPSERLLNEVTEFVLDIIYSNIHIDIVSPPKLIIMEKDVINDELSTKYFTQLLLLMSEFSNVKPLYFIPSYITRSKLEKLVDLYINVYGLDGLFVIDMDRARFTSRGYSIVAQVMRIMEHKYRHEHYGVYLFNHKSRKKSGREVPSEDIIAILSGVNFIGPSHGNIPLPPGVVEKIKQQGLGSAKVFYERDFLYYPVNIAPNLSDLINFIGRKRTSTLIDQYYVNLYNDFKTNKVILELNSKDLIEHRLSSLERDVFRKELDIYVRKVYNILKSRYISSFFSN